MIHPQNKGLKLKCSEKALKEFLKNHGKSKKSYSLSGITIETLTKCLHSSASSISNRSPSIKSKKKNSLIKTQSFSTRSSSNVLEESSNRLNYTLPQRDIIEPVFPKASDKQVFIEHILDIFENPEQATDYFFLDRGLTLFFDDFNESISCLGLSEVYIKIKDIFKSLAKSKLCITKQEFYQELFDTQCKEIDETMKVVYNFRAKLIKTFGNHIKAFEEISGGRNCITCLMMENIAKKLGVRVENGQIVKMFKCNLPGMKIHFKEFKEFWTGKDHVCMVKSCDKDVENGEVYCKKHIKCLVIRGEGIYSKLRMIMKREQLLAFSQEILKDDKKRPRFISSLELKKKDIQALKEFFKVKGINKPRMTTSVKNRV
ncbi:hypothetical protein SteCoe_36092 [Stentor coeruleus]|uniref:Uncharacterized protein n=1 Tax=Stentor coeruleus TaxID=5963 RepID=A0A1R2AQZ6_9CILI|nr:hypothetical protein SteCoe_36092 [Stentor coeruleus]